MPRSINFAGSVHYGLGVLRTALAYRLNRWGLARSKIFDRDGRKLDLGQPVDDYYFAVTASPAHTD